MGDRYATCLWPTNYTRSCFMDFVVTSGRLLPGNQSRAGGGGMEVRNFSNFFLQFLIFFAIFFGNSAQFCHNCFLLVHLACLLVPCVSPVQKSCSLRHPEVWLAAQFSRNSAAIFRNCI